MILLETIKIRLQTYVNSDILYKEFDCRYLSKWIKLYPNCFAKYVLNNNYSIKFNYLKLRYEINKL